MKPNHRNNPKGETGMKNIRHCCLEKQPEIGVGFFKYGKRCKSGTAGADFVLNRSFQVPSNPEQPGTLGDEIETTGSRLAGFDNFSDFAWLVSIVITPLTNSARLSAFLLPTLPKLGG